MVAITGSAGKTTTKEDIAALLEGTFTVVKNPGNLNNHLGLPLSLLELRHGADVAVMELGMNHAGRDSRARRVGRARRARVDQRRRRAHRELRHRRRDRRGEGRDSRGAARDGVLVANADDPRVMRCAAGFAGRVVTFGYGEGADVRAVEVEELDWPACAPSWKTPIAESGGDRAAARSRQPRERAVGGGGRRAGRAAGRHGGERGALAPARRRGEVRISATA